MIGIICKNKLEGAPDLFSNFRLGLKNYFDTNFKNIEHEDDLDNINILIIVDEHWPPHVDIWKCGTFISRLNDLNIKTLVFNFERIVSQHFQWNIEHQQKLETIKNLQQLVSDVDDFKIRELQIQRNKKATIAPFINKQLLSRDTKLEYEPVEKKDRILFIGQSDPAFNATWAYARRFNILNELKHRDDVPLDIHVTNRELTYKEYLTKLASYKFILNPLGTGDFINVRFYEALKLGCIPIQQVTDNMIGMYSELSENICTTFKTSADVHGNQQVPADFQIPTGTFSTFDYYLEDYFEDIQLSKLLE